MQMADDTTLMAESKEELKNLLIKVKEESEKAGLKLNIQKTNIMASSPITSWQIDGEKWKQWQTSFSWAPKSLWLVTSAMKLKDAFSLEEKLWQTQTDVSNDKGWYRQSYGSIHVQMWELDHKEGWVLKNWRFWTVVLEKILESLELQGDPTSLS